VTNYEFRCGLMTNLIYHRKERGMTQEMMAARLGVGRPQIANIEGLRSTITVYQLYLWCKACGISISDAWPQ
jgi:transcriptional regulator with XRE-family HTH domain